MEKQGKNLMKGKPRVPLPKGGRGVVTLSKPLP